MKWILSFFLLMCAVQDGFAAFQKRTIVHLEGGSYHLSDQEYQLSGSQTGLGLKHLYSENWAWFMNLSQGAAEQRYQSAVKVNQVIKAQTTGVSAGFEWRVALDSGEMVLPFVGLGGNGLGYQISDTNASSSIGNTSGTGFGPVMRTGIRFTIGKHFVVIPSYQYSALQIKTASGLSRTWVYSGTFLGLVASF